MSIPLITRGRSARWRATAGDHVGTIFRGLGVALVLALLVAVGIALAAFGGATGYVMPLAVLECVVLVSAASLAAFGYRELQRGVVLPLAQLASASTQAESVPTPVRGGTQDIQMLAAALGSLGTSLRQERRRQTDQADANLTQAGMLRQVLRFTKEVGSTLEVKEVLRTTAEGALEVSNHAEVVIWFIDDIDRRLVPKYDSCARVPIAPTIPSRHMAETAAGRAATTGQTVTIRNDPMHPERVTGLAVPLTFGTGLTVIGVIELSRPRSDQINVDTVDALETLAGHAALAIQASNLYEEVERRSETDGLTKVLNRRRLDADIRSEVARSVRYGHKLSLVMVDVDHFKGINDTFGHQQGDEVLKMVALTLHRECRTTDGAYRFGGEEFALLLRDTDAEAAGEVADRIRVRVSEAVATLGLPRVVTASLGVSSVSSQITTIEALVEAADGALYQAKEGGRNRVIVSERAMT